MSFICRIKEQGIEECFASIFVEEHSAENYLKSSNN